MENRGTLGFERMLRITVSSTCVSVGHSRFLTRFRGRSASVSGQVHTAFRCAELEGLGLNSILFLRLNFCLEKLGGRKPVLVFNQF